MRSIPTRPPGVHVEPAGTAQHTASVLDVEDLSVTFRSEAGDVAAVRGISYQVRAGEVLGIVGESGSGKSVSSLAIMGLLPANARGDGLGSLSRARTDRPSDRRAVGDPGPADLDDLPGSAVGAHPRLHRRRPDRRGDPGSTTTSRGRRRTRAPSSC